MRIEFLQAGSGDCIWISHNKINIVVDGGKLTTSILERYDKMPQSENIDLLVVTHIDSDHIAGVIALVEQIKTREETERLKRVWFNFPKKECSGEYSVSEGNNLSDSLCKIEGLNWSNNTSDFVGNVLTIGDIRLSVLAPDHDVANEYKSKSPEELGIENVDWNTGLKTLIENVDDDDTDVGGPNCQSIVILVECQGKAILLPGDCTPKELYGALHKHNSIHGSPLKLDLIKLPHHGSKRSVTKSIFSEIECTRFVISTNVNKKYNYPHKETIAKLICYRNDVHERVDIFFNYQESMDVLCITDEEQNNNNIKLEVCREFNF